MTPPTGTITFVFTDIIGSTRLWERFPEAMAAAIRQHDDLLREVFTGHGGFVFKTVGDSFCVAFADPSAALAAAAEVHSQIAAARWDGTGPLSVRVAVHAGPAELRGGDYFGQTLSRVARIESAAHGGQVLVSSSVGELVRETLPAGFGLKDLGKHLLRSIERPEHLYQLTGPGLRGDFPSPRGMSVLPNNLPTQTTSFIGREKELAAVLEALGGATRLLTLTGSGGTGKTRLALESAARMVGMFRDGVWLVELALVGDASKLLEAVAEAAGVREEPGQPLHDTLLGALRGKDTLLLLDNCEHLTGAAASLATELLRVCPKLKILATSRHSLGIKGESTHAVPPLGIFDRLREPGEAAGSPARLAAYDAVRLFVERAAAVRPGFRLDDSNAAAVGEICSRLDGIPLALELAAARMRLLDAGELAARLGDRFRIIKGGNADRLPHQQTLKALIDWSFELLSEPERALFRRLAVFRGGRSLEAVEAVCSGGVVAREDVIDHLQQLIEKSLVSTEPGGSGALRYVLLESVWHYARTKLAESGEESGARDRHLAWFLKWAERAAPEFEGPDQKQWIERFNDDAFNFDAAFAWCHSQGRAEEGVRLLAALGRPLEVRGYLTEAREHALRVLDEGSGVAPGLLARATASAARLAWAKDLYDEGEQFFRRASELARDAGDSQTAHLCDAFLGFFARGNGDIDTAERAFADGLARSEESGDRRLRAMCLSGLGRVAYDRGELEKARALAEESLALYRELGDLWIIGLILWGVANIAIAQGDVRRAASAVCEWGAIATDLGNTWILPYILATFGNAAMAAGNPRRAARFHAAATVLRERFGSVFTPIEAREHEAQIAAIRAALEKEEFDSAWEDGLAADPAELLTEARSTCIHSQ